MWRHNDVIGVTYSSSGVGTTPHLAGGLFGLRTGLKAVHVPFRGSATVDVSTGMIDFALDNVASYTAFLKTGGGVGARALAVTAIERCESGVFPCLCHLLVGRHGARAPKSAMSSGACGSPQTRWR